MADMQCFIWDTPATLARASGGDSVFIDSPRAGGAYQISGTASSTIAGLSTSERAKLTTWLCNQRAAGVEYPFVTDALVSGVKGFPVLTTSQRIDRVLLYM